MYTTLQKQIQKQAQQLTIKYCNKKDIDAVAVKKCKIPNPFPVGVNNFYSVYCGRPVNWNIYEKMLSWLEKKGV